MPSKKITALVVEDEKLIASNIAKTIEKTNPNFQVIKICSNGREALQFVQNHPPNVIFTDIRMPVMDGMELIKTIAANYQFIHCVILSGYNDFEYARQALQLGAANYILKPLNPRELAEALRILERKIASARQEWPEETEDEEYTAEEIVFQVKEYIQNNYQLPIDLTTIAGHFGFSSAYLSKIFTKHEGIAPSKYIRTHRMNMAKQLLADPSLSINTIAGMIGYADPYHFSKTFKAHTGETPVAHRKK